MMRRNLALAFAGCALVLAGSCVSPEELRREDEARCAGYGFQTGTPEFANCLQQENLARLYTAPPPAPYWGIGAAFWDRAVAITVTTITIGWLMAIGPISIKRRLTQRLRPRKLSQTPCRDWIGPPNTATVQTNPQ